MCCYTLTITQQIALLLKVSELWCYMQVPLLLYYHRCFIFVKCWELSQQTLSRIRIYTPKESSISSDYLQIFFSSFFCPAIYHLTTLIIYCPVLLLIPIILVRSCICFKLMCSIHSDLTFCLLIPIIICLFYYQLGNVENYHSREKH